MKRTLLLICTLLCTNVLLAQNLFLSGQLYYAFNSNSSVVVYGYNSSNPPTDLVIPETVTYQGTTFNVTGIDYGAFCFYYNGNWVESPCTTLTSVDIPNSVTSIGDGAFRNCSSLTSVTCLRSNSPSLGSDVFYGTPNNKTLTIPCGCESEYTDWQNATTWASIDCIVLIGNRFTIGDLTYEITSETEVKVQDCTESATSVVIPSTITYQGTTYDVTSIGQGAFQSCSSLTSVDIPNSVTSIGGGAFYNCSSLTSVTIPNSVTSIGWWAFISCSGLTSITIPNSVTSIGDGAFAHCSSLTSVTIPNSVTSIGDEAFYNCSSLTSVTIPNSVTSIGDEVFKNCSSLTSITIPNSVTSIGGGGFYNCSSLTSVTLSNNITELPCYYYGSNADGFFENCSSLSSITIPNSVTSIGDGAFRNCSSLTSVTCLRSNSPSLDSDVFDGTPNNKTLTIPCGCESEYTDWQNATTWASIDCIVTIGSRFTIGDLTYEIISETEVSVQDCTESATSVVIPSIITYQGTTYDVTSIGFAAFSGCSNLTSVTIPNSVTSIGGGAFSECSSLTSITIPNSVTYIGDIAFSYCSSLTSVTIPNSVTSIGFGAFAYCSSLTSVDIPNSVTSIGDFISAFTGCSSVISLSIDMTSIPWLGIGASLQNLTLGDNVTSIEDSAFAGCSSLTYMTIEMNNIPNLSNTGLNTASLQNLTLGENVTSIASGTFNNCSFLQNVTCLATTPPTIADNTVFPYPNIATLTVPCGTLEAYSAPTSFWNVFFMGRMSENGYDVLATANDNAFGSVAVANDCSSATLTATANEGYVFLSWNDGNTENPRIVSLTSDTSFVANFIVSTVNTEITATICQGQTYTENGFNVSEAGVYTQNLTASNGADSIVTLTLNVNPIYNTELSATICEGQVYTENNFNVSEAGVYTQTLTAVNGCDSIVTLTLNVNPIYNTELTATICEGQVYTENNFNVSEAGVYTQTLTSVNGCDSIVTLTLNILPSYNTNLTATICQGSELNISGFNVSEAGVYTQNLTSVNGCDSIVTLTVTELPIIHTDLTLTICEGTSSNFSGFNVSEAGVYTQTHTAENGCDSIVTLTVTELPTVHTDLTLTICEGTSLNFSGFNVSEAGTYTQTLQTANGCDSIVTLVVTTYPTFDTTITATINAGEMYSEFGFNESEAGTYVQNLQTVNGCDSTITLILDVNSSLMDVEDTESISFFPNPTKSEITFSQAIESIEVIDQTGRCVLTFSNAREINIESLPSGAYYLRLTSNDKAIMRKVIKE